MNKVNYGGAGYRIGYVRVSSNRAFVRFKLLCPHGMDVTGCSTRSKNDVEEMLNNAVERLNKSWRFR